MTHNKEKIEQNQTQNQNDSMPDLWEKIDPDYQQSKDEDALDNHDCHKTGEDGCDCDSYKGRELEEDNLVTIEK